MFSKGRRKEEEECEVCSETREDIPHSRILLTIITENNQEALCFLSLNGKNEPYLGKSIKLSTAKNRKHINRPLLKSVCLQVCD